MKLLAFSALVALIFSSCPMNGTRVYDAFFGKDKSIPKVLKYEMEDNSRMRIIYDEDVTLMEVVFNGKILDYSMHGTIFNIPFQTTLKRGETAIFSIMAEDNAGNTSRSSFKLIGKNTEIPEALINEVSIKGTSESPDRVEILFMESGSAAGMIVSDGLISEENHYVVLPDISVNRGDTIVIYWDKEAESLEPVFDEGRMGYFINGESDTTLSGTNGALLIYNELDGKIIDGIIYTTGESELSGGYGNNRTRNAAMELMRLGLWEGEPVSSVLVTASRVIARLPGGQDTNSADDFFITEARKSTFGTTNEYFPYSE